MSWAEVKYLQDHTGTGIPPQKPDFKAVPGDKKVTVKWSIPESTTIEGQEVCRAKGIIVRRKTDGYPTDENDGTLIVSTDQISGSVVDSDVTNKTTYYYRAFSYSDHNVINRNPAAESKATPDEVESCEVTVAASDGAKSLGDDVITRVTLTNETKSTTETADLSGGVGSTTFSIQGGEVYHISTQLIKADAEVDYVTGTDAVYAIANATSESYTAVLGNAREVAMPITALPKTESFSADSWDTITQYSESGLASKFYGVGDEKTVSINGTNYAVTIMDFDHDDLTDGSGKAGITFGLKNCLTTTHNMNSSDSNSGGWESCAMRSWLQSTVLEWLPEELQAVIKKVNKKATAGSKSTTIKTSEDNLFLLAEVEIFGSKTYGSLDEGTQYSYFATTTRRVKKSGDSGSATYWWERSPYVGASASFCRVTSDGSAGSNSAGGTYGVSFGFCI